MRATLAVLSRQTYCSSNSKEISVNFDRIKNVMNIPMLQEACVVLIGAGASITLAINLLRCGVRRFILIDPDRIEPSNIARQGHDPANIGQTKVQALARMIEQMNPEAEVTQLPIDFTTLSDDEVNETFHEVSLIIAATDSFKAQARANQAALMLRVSSLFIGLYARGDGGEIIFWHPDLDSCFRCLCANRYDAFEHAAAQGQSIDPSSDGADIFAIQLLDANAGQIAIGLLTRGSDDKFGRLIEQLGDRQFIQLKISPDFRINGRDVIREKLGVADDCDAFFAWNAIALKDPDGGQLPCADCEKYRDVSFIWGLHGGPSVRIKTGQPTPLTEIAPTIDPMDSPINPSVNQ